MLLNELNIEEDYLACLNKNTFVDLNVWESSGWGRSLGFLSTVSDEHSSFRHYSNVHTGTDPTRQVDAGLCV